MWLILHSNLRQQNKYFISFQMLRLIGLKQTEIQLQLEVETIAGPIFKKKKKKPTHIHL